MATTETAQRPAIVHGDVVQLEALKSEREVAKETRVKAIVAGHDVSAMTTRIESLDRKIASLEELLVLYPVERREAEQAELRENKSATFAVRTQNWEDARADEAEAVEYERLAEESRKRAHAKKTAADGYFTACQNLDRHIARFGDLSTGAQ